MFGLKFFKKGEMHADETTEIILGGLALAVLLVLFILLFPTHRGTDAQKASDSYFDSFMEEIEKANRGQTGEFIMWQGPGGDRRNDNVFFVYFNDSYKFQIGDMVFVSFNRRNSFCVCSWEDGQAECRDRNCKELSLPIRFNGEDKQFIISVGNQMEISRGENFYEVLGSVLEE